MHGIVHNTYILVHYAITVKISSEIMLSVIMSNIMAQIATAIRHTILIDGRGAI